MCGRFIQISDPEVIRLSVPGLEIDPAVREGASARYNIAPTQHILAVLNTSKPLLTRVRWGLVPFWARDPSVGGRMINARGETLREKSSFRTPLRKRRCIIFSEGFYEWKTGHGGKRPYLIRMKDSRPFGMAGLWDLWKDAGTGREMTTAAIVTTTPNTLTAAIHDRMPAVLKPADYPVWLDAGTPGDETLMSCIAPYPPGEMEAFEVSRLVNSPENDSPACILALES